MEDELKPVKEKRTAAIGDVMSEIRNYCNGVKWNEYTSLVDFAASYFELLPMELHMNLVEETIILLDTEVKARMDYPLDILRIEWDLNLKRRQYGKMSFSKTQIGGRNVITIDHVMKIKKVERPVVIKEKRFLGLDNDTDLNSMIENTIDEYLEPFKDKAFRKNDYPFIIATLKAFFVTETCDTRTVYFVNKGNKKKLGMALGSLYAGLRTNNITYEYIDLCKQIFVCFNGIQIDRNDRFNNLLYKYLTTKR